MFRARVAIISLGLLVIAGGSAHALEKVTIGNTKVVVKTVTGDLDQEKRQIQFLDDIYHNELIETGDESATEIVFLDETKLALGPNSKLTLDKFVYDPDPDQASFIMTATAGVFRFASGKLPKKSYVIHTPTATIGIRGTIFTIVVLPGSADDAGNSPAVNITTESGIVEITTCLGDHLSLNETGQSTTIFGRSQESCGVMASPGPQPPEFVPYVETLGSYALK